MALIANVLLLIVHEGYQDVQCNRANQLNRSKAPQVEELVAIVVQNQKFVMKPPDSFFLA